MNLDKVFSKMYHLFTLTAVVFITAVFLLSCSQKETTASEILTGTKLTEASEILTGTEETVSEQQQIPFSENTYLRNYHAEETVSDRILTNANVLNLYQMLHDTEEMVSVQNLTKYYDADDNLPEIDGHLAENGIITISEQSLISQKAIVSEQEEKKQVTLPEKANRDSIRLNLPAWVTLSGKELSAEDKIEFELTEGNLKLMQKDEIIWESGDSMLVQDFLWCDIDSDGGKELLLLCWKQGKYGQHRPFWVEENDTDISQHIFIYDWDGKQISQLWLASDIGIEITQWDYDEHGFLIALDTKGETSSWAWLSWGLEAVDTSVTFAAVGDDLIHMQIVGCGKQKGNYDFMFEHVKDRVQQADIAVINQETMFVDNPAQYSGFPRFGSPAAIGDAIKNAGFDVVTCGNNHSVDKGMSGINTTYRKLKNLGLVVLGIHGEEISEYSGGEESVSENAENEDDELTDFVNYDNNRKPYEIITKKRIRFAMLNYTYGTNGHAVPRSHPDAVNLLTEEDKIRKDLKLARDDADIVMVFVHWGTEYQKQPDDFQKKWTEVFLQEGVDVVVGTHPHVVQPFEMFQREDGHEMLVYYSLGNFISAQDSIETVIGGFAEFTISITMDGCKITSYDMLPLVTHQQKGAYTTYFLEDYTEELAGKHRLHGKGLTLAALQEEFSKNVMQE